MVSKSYQLHFKTGIFSPRQSQQPAEIFFFFFFKIDDVGQINVKLDFEIHHFNPCAQSQVGWRVEQVSLPVEGDWNKMIFKIPSNSKFSVIL